jgi:hypothetical protein
MSTADKAIRYSTVVAVVIVAAVAASFSYLHAMDVINAHSRPSLLNYVFPLTVDGLIFAGSMVLLNDAKRGLDPHPLAYAALALGISATLTVNVVSGLAYGLVGAVVSAWPAVALVLSYELLMSATTADIEVAESDGILHLRVRDDGRGGADISHGTGLLGLKDRAEALGGHLQVHSPPGAGTTLDITLPLDDPGGLLPPPEATDPGQRSG